ncbi:hypothetical protein HRbin30_00460 [bacterium HR30]|nr:hypothetical protein HRbin30_00460 [bacterium HR30]
MWENLGVVIRVMLFGALSFYLPGRAWSAWIFAARKPTAFFVPPLLLELAVSVVTATLVGFVLLEASVWSPLTFAAVTSSVAALGWWASRDKAKPVYGREDLLLLFVGAAAAWWLLPPFEARFASGDATGYLAAGIHAARVGSFEVSDPTVGLMDIDLRRILFPSVAMDRGSPPYLRLEGGYVLQSLDGAQVLPAFHHGIVPWVALTVTLVGSSAAEWVFGVFGVLALVAVYGVARSLQLSPPSSLAVVTLAAVQPVLFFYCRFPMPEVTAAFFLWCGVALALGAGPSTVQAVLAGLALGCAALIRLENAFLVCTGLTLAAILSPPGTRLAWAFFPAFLLSGHALLHAYFWRTHYWGNLINFLASQATTTRSLVLFGLAAGLVAYTVWSNRGGRKLTTVRAQVLAVAVAVAFAAAVQLWARNTAEWSLLWDWSGGLLLMFGLAGLFVAAAAASSLAQTLVICLVVLSGLVFFLGPQATPADLWVLRRATTVLIPGLCLTLVWGATELCRPLPRKLGTLCLSATLLLALFAPVPRLLTVINQEYYTGGAIHSQMLATSLDRPAALLVHGSLAPLSIAPLLWATSEAPVYYVTNPQDWLVADLLRALARVGRPIYFLLPGDLPPYNPPANGGWRPHLRYRFAWSSPFQNRPLAAPTWKEIDLSIYRWQASP